MGFVERELERLNCALNEGVGDPRYPEIYAAQQALSWALDPTGFRSPYNYLFNIPTKPSSDSDRLPKMSE